MRLGCKAIANDYNPVAWFILKCTLEYPQRLAGKTHPLPELNLDERPDLTRNDLADHVRLWGQWVLEHARRDLAPYYPVIDGKPTVAYLWARTIPCQDQDSRECGGIIPLLKTLWICKKAEKTLQDTPENRNRPDVLRLRETRNQTKVIINGKRALKLCPDSETRRVRFEIVVPEDTADVGEPTMSGATATCPFCGSQQPADYIKRCGQESKLKAQLTTVVYQEEYGKEYRPPTPVEIDAAEIPVEVLGAIADEIPHGVPDEPLPSKERHRSVGSQLPDYGFKAWSDLFTARQLLALMTFVKWTRLAREKIECSSYPPEWVEAIEVYLAINVDRLADYASTICIWETHANEVKHTFARFALPMTWDFAEGNPLSGQNRYYKGGIEYVGRFLTKTLSGLRFGQSHPEVVNLPAQVLNGKPVSTIITDPPYYDAIPYADLSDFFYVWLRRSIGDQFPDAFAKLITPKSDELVQHSDHFDGNNKAAKEFYESGMATTFQSARDLLTDNGRIVIVFAHKSPDAWETLVKAMIESGLVVTASWPIDTELKNSISSQGCASLATSLWMVCRKRPANAREGRYSKVKREMEERITERLRYFWDAGIQGPDFVWAAIGPALESYSSYKEVRRNTGEPFTVSDFLTEVRRIVTDFALGQILGGASTEALDEWTRYYLMHRNHFGTEDAPVGECILLAQGYGVSLDALTADRIGILKKASSGSKLRLLGHTDRNSDRVGQPHSSGGLPMIDMLHRVLNLWDAGDKAPQLNAYLAEHGLRENALFKAVIQALIETSPPGTKERSLLETIINYQSSPSVGGDESSASGGRDGQQLTIKGVLS
jgi:adenine-specific DNA methylase